MFWILINHKLPDNERFTDWDMFKKYWVKYQLYIEWQKYLMERMRQMHDNTWRIVWMNATAEVLVREFWELNLAKYMYLMNRNTEIVRRYSEWFFDEMFEIMWEEKVSKIRE